MFSKFDRSIMKIPIDTITHNDFSDEVEFLNNFNDEGLTFRSQHSND